MCVCLYGEVVVYFVMGDFDLFYFLPQNYWDVWLCYSKEIRCISGK
jgi:hypothetical protein